MLIVNPCIVDTDFFKIFSVYMLAFQAIQALKQFQSTATRKALTDILENEQCFYKVRIEASMCLAKVRLITSPEYSYCI